MIDCVTLFPTWLLFLRPSCGEAYLLTPNSLRTIVAFYIAFKEASIRESSTEEFTDLYCIYALVKHEDFWYMSNRGPNVEGLWSVRDNMGNYKDRFFFYPSKRYRDWQVSSLCIFVILKLQLFFLLMYVHFIQISNLGQNFLKNSSLRSLSSTQSSKSSTASEC